LCVCWFITQIIKMDVTNVKIKKICCEFVGFCLFVLFVFLALQPTVVVFSLLGSALKPPRVRRFQITHNDAPQSVGLLWTSDQSIADAST
jgi:hypothetical protein